jgi:hypothetical protein
MTVAVAGSGPTPTGTITLVGGGYLGGSQTLSSGGYTFNLPAFSLAAGTDTMVASYSGDTNYLAGSSTVSVTVTKAAPAGISVTPNQSTVASNAALTVVGTVTGATGGPTPTGSVTLSGGGYTSSATALTGGAYSIVIPASSLAAGSDTLTATYSGDGFYTGISNTATVTVTVVSTFTLSASSTTAVNRGSASTSTVTVNGTGGYAGTVTLACSLNSGGPSNQSGDAPGCTIPATAVGAGGTATATVTTVAATSSALVRPDFGRNKETLAGLGLAALALLALLGIPAQRRAIRGLLGMFVLLLTLGSLAACGGGGGGSSSGGGSGGGTSNPGTASGTYTFTVTGTGNPAVSPAPTTTFTVTVN